MSCPLTIGFDNDCNDGIGGLQPGELYITQKENVPTTPTTVAGVITVLPQTGSTAFYRYKLRKAQANFDGANTSTPETGSNFITNTLVFLMSKMSAVKNVELKLLTQKPCIVIVKDLNGVYHAFGIETGVEFTVNSSSGKVAGDMNGYTITGIDESKDRYTVSSGVMASLVVGEPS